MVVGTVLATLGSIGLVVAFGIFFYFGYQWILTSQESLNTIDSGSFESRSDASLQGWLRAVAAFPVFFVSAILAAIGTGLRRSAERKQV
jgi:energy-coupling factor transporter transmembrane protein EcfT